jgi:GNAT superfamily N-acetyltransferase
MKSNIIFDHFCQTFAYAAEKGKFDTERNINGDIKVVTTLDSASFNFIRFKGKNFDVLENILTKNISFSCWHYENTTSEFKDYLLKKGMKFYSKAESSFYSNLQEFVYSPNNDIKIKQISNIDELEIFDRIAANCFCYPQNMSTEFFKNSINDKNILFYIAFLEDIPVGTSILSLAGNIAGLYWDAVLPEYRNRQIGLEMVKFRMNIAKNMGYNSICAQNLDSSVGYYKKIGFKQNGIKEFFYIGQE